LPKSHSAQADNSPRTMIRSCQVCALPATQREALEAVMRSGQQRKGHSVQSLSRDFGLTISQPLLSRHKKECLGLCGSKTPNAVDLPSTELAVIVDVAWVPDKVRETARQKLLVAAKMIEAQIAVNPTAAYYHTWLEFLQELIKESEKSGGALENQAKNYLEEVQSKRREVTRTVTQTIKEVVTEVADKSEPVSAQAAVFSETGTV